MSSSTARYRFEFRLFDWAEAYSRDMCGERRAFFIGIREDGSPRRVYFARQDDQFDGERKAALAESHPVWILFGPADDRGSGYLEWYGLEKDVAERWVKRPFEATDFIDVRASGGRDGWPTSWRVLVG
jgi:hypothetical protein